jgi:pyruvate formate lyase activating enzyme
VSFENLKTLDPVLDGYIVDIKDMNPEIYQAYTGKDNVVVLKNLEWLLQHRDPNCIMVRVPHIPDLNTDEDVAKSIERLKGMGVTKFDEFKYIIR